MTIVGIEQLKKIIEDDLARKNAKHIRFINIEKMSVWVKIKDFIASLCPRDNQIMLSKYCSDVDLTPKTTRLLADLKNVTENTVVVPLSEHIRINNDTAESLLSSIISLDYELESSEQELRIYFPMYRMKSLLQKIVNSDQRLKESIWFLELEECDDDYSLTILPKMYRTTIKGNNLNGYQNYLLYWESNPCKPIILHTNNAVYYRNNIYNDNVIVLTTAYDILYHHKIIDSRFEEKNGSEQNWDTVLETIDTLPSFDKYIRKYIKLTEFNPEDVIKKFVHENSDFGKWLAWIWIKAEACTPYLKYCVSKTSNWAELSSTVIFSIFDFSINDTEYWSIYNERKNILAKLLQKTLPTLFWDKLNSIPSAKAINYLTDVTENERIEIIKKYSGNLKLKEYENVIEKIYPDLWAYLGASASGIEQIDKYFEEYRINKVQNYFPNSFVDRVNTIGREKGLWWKLGIKSRNSIVDEEYNDNTYIFYLDAFGAEFIPYVTHLLKTEYRSIFYDSKIGYAELPTVTDFNKEFVRGRNSDPRITYLDEAVHFGAYPQYISEELKVIRDTIINAVTKLDEYEKVIITADHGASRGIVIAKGQSEKTSENAKVERDGRYCIDSSMVYEDSFPYCIDVGKYHVMTNYDRFSISGASKNENHGGATLEEVLVAIIILSRTPLFEKAKIIDSDINIKPTNGIVHVTFKLNVDAKNVVALVMGERYVCLKENGCYAFNAKVTGAAEYTAQVISDGQINEFRYSVQTGIKKKMDI